MSSCLARWDSARGEPCPVELDSLQRKGKRIFWRCQRCRGLLPFADRARPRDGLAGEGSSTRLENRGDEESILRLLLVARALPALPSSNLDRKQDTRQSGLDRGAALAPIQEAAPAECAPRNISLSQPGHLSWTFMRSRRLFDSRYWGVPNCWT
jgi:hypothetical protein